MVPSGFVYAGRDRPTLRWIALQSNLLNSLPLCFVLLLRYSSALCPNTQLTSHSADHSRQSSPMKYDRAITDLLDGAAYG